MQHVDVYQMPMTPKDRLGARVEDDAAIILGDVAWSGRFKTSPTISQKYYLSIPIKTFWLWAIIVRCVLNSLLSTAADCTIQDISKYFAAAILTMVDKEPQFRVFLIDAENTVSSMLWPDLINLK